MNEEIKEKTISLAPFTKLCMTIGNLPSSYFESMSYYEQLIWFTKYLQEQVIPAVNQNAAAVTELQGYYIELQNYVNDYFENLDVQEEINNKLDEMAEDGSLTNLIKNYVDSIYQPYETQINNTIDGMDNRMDNFDSRLSAVASGSPLVASSTAGMTETDRVYVNTTDGKWYYYNGSAWTVGGTYQTSGIANGSVTFENLESELQETFIPNYDKTTSLPTKNYVINTSGNEQSGTNYGYYEIDVTPFDTYKIYIYFPNAIATASYVRTMFKHDNSVISYTTGDSVPERDAYGYYEEIINIPYNVNKLIINCGSVNEKKCGNYIIKVDNYKEKDISINQLDTNLKSFFNAQYTEVTPTLFVDNSYLGFSGTISTYSSTKLYKLSVNPHEVYKCTIKQIYNNPIIALGHRNNTYTQTISDATYTLYTIDTITDEESGHQFTDYILEIPSWCTEIYINKGNSDSTFKIEKLTGYKVKVDDIEIPADNPLYGKTLCFAGDSLMAATTEGYKGWVGIMAENNPDTNFYNYGHDGYTIAKAEDTWSSRSIQNVMPTILSEHPSTDYIVLEGGVNDYYGSEHGITLGEISSGFNPANFDRTTFSGGLEYLFNYVYENFQGTRLVYIVTHRCYISGLYQFMDRAKEICNKWAVPYIDLWNDSNINFNISYMRQRFSKDTESAPNGDGLHPNLAGYEVETPIIEKFLKYKV